MSNLPSHSKIFSSHGIVLSRRYYSEADAIITLFTDDLGKVSFAAKGIKKLKSRKRGTLEPFSEIKFSAVRTRNLPILIETNLENNFSQIRNSLKKISVAYYFLELINKVSAEDEENEDLYVFLTNYLKELENTSKLKSLRLNFARELLIISGFWPEGKPLPEIDFNIEKMIERSLNSVRVGRALSI